MSVRERLDGRPLWYVTCVLRMNRVDRWLWWVGWIEPQDEWSWVWTAEGFEHLLGPASGIGLIMAMGLLLWGAML